MPERFKQETVRQAAPIELEYRSGHDEHESSGPLPKIDGPLVRGTLFLLGIPFGAVFGFVMLVTVIAIWNTKRFSPNLVVIPALLLTAIECLAASHAGKPPERRLTFFVQGTLGTAILIHGLWALATIYSWMSKS